jgi:hypothetical protein
MRGVGEPWPGQEEAVIPAQAGISLSLLGRRSKGNEILTFVRMTRLALSSDESAP